MKVIKIGDKEYKKLEDYKVHPSQPFHEVIKKILNKKEELNGEEQSSPDAFKGDEE